MLISFYVVSAKAIVVDITRFVSVGLSVKYIIIVYIMQIGIVVTGSFVVSIPLLTYLSQVGRALIMPHQYHTINVLIPWDYYFIVFGIVIISSFLAFIFAVITSVKSAKLRLSVFRQIELL